MGVYGLIDTREEKKKNNLGFLAGKYSSYAYKYVQSLSKTTAA